MKRVWVMLLVLCLALSMLLGCSAGKEAAESKGNLGTAEEPVTIRVMSWGTTAFWETWEATLRANFPEWSDRVKIEWLVGGEDDNALAERFRMALASNESIADVILFNYTQVPEFARAGALLDLSDFLAPYQDDLTGAAKVLSKVDDMTVAVPNMINGKMYVYRQDIFAECGIDPTTWKTIDDMVAASDKLHETYPDKYLYNYSRDVGITGYDAYMIMTSTGASFIDGEGNYIVDKSPEMRKTLETIKKIYDSNIGYNTEELTTDWGSAIAGGEMVGDLTASWAKMIFPAYAGDQTGLWNCCLWPEEIRTGSEAGGSVWVIPKNTGNEAAAKEFLELLCLNDEAAMLLYENNERSPIRVSVYEKLDKSPAMFVDGYWKVELESCSEVNFAVFNYDPKAVTEMSIFNGWLTKYQTGAATIDETLAGIQTDMSTQIGNAFE